MKVPTTKIALVLVTALALSGAGIANAGKPAPNPGGDGAFNCADLSISAFQDACNLNNDLAGTTENGAYGNYIGSCSPNGGRCDDSVYNKLVSASNKVDAGKVQPDACDNLASIQTDLTTWFTASKPKIDQLGYNNLSAEISALQGMYCQ